MNQLDNFPINFHLFQNDERNLSRWSVANWQQYFNNLLYLMFYILSNACRTIIQICKVFNHVIFCAYFIYYDSNLYLFIL